MPDASPRYQPMPIRWQVRIWNGQSWQTVADFPEGSNDADIQAAWEAAAAKHERAIAVELRERLLYETLPGTGFATSRPRAENE